MLRPRRVCLWDLSFFSGVFFMWPPGPLRPFFFSLSPPPGGGFPTLSAGRFFFHPTRGVKTQPSPGCCVFPPVFSRRRLGTFPREQRCLWSPRVVNPPAVCKKGGLPKIWRAGFFGKSVSPPPGCFSPWPPLRGEKVKMGSSGGARNSPPFPVPFFSSRVWTPQNSGAP